MYSLPENGYNIRLMRMSDYHFDLPDELIAAYPRERREDSRLLVLDRVNRTWEHRRFLEIGDFLSPDDLLVLNNTRVLPARVWGKQPTGGEVELLFLEEKGAGVWSALARGKNLRPGTRVVVGGERFELIERTGEVWLVQTGEALPGLLFKIGKLPLPPYIVHQRRDAGDAEYWSGDAERYQTVYASEEGAVAAPTAGLHFTPELLASLAEQGVKRSEITLHVGLGTFLPVRVDDVSEHRMHSERVEIGAETVARIQACKQGAGRVVAVGTTVVRALEGAYAQTGELTSFRGATDVFITPGFSFRVVDRLLTNFHLPESTLLMLVSALADRELILAAYREAVKERYRFFSYGDAMLIL